MGWVLRRQTSQNRKTYQGEGKLKKGKREKKKGFKTGG